MKNNLTGNYELANDIDCSAAYFWNGGLGFEPVGGPTALFAGSFDGKRYRIVDLTIARPTQNYVGLFGSTASTSQIHFVGMTEGSISGKDLVGSLVGYNRGTLRNCYAEDLVVSGEHTVGGLIGTNYQEGNINACYAACEVGAPDQNAVGGLVGNNYGILTNSYANSNVVGFSGVGGLAGATQTGMIGMSYSTSTVSGTAGSVGGLVGNGLDGSVLRSYWDTQTSGQSTSGGGEGKTTAQMLQQATFINWDFSCTWRLVEGNAPPQLAEENCFGLRVNIDNCQALQMAVSVPAAAIYLEQEIDCTDTVNWNGGAGFLPGYALWFSGGQFDGKGYAITNLVINRPSTNRVGLFAEASYAAQIHSVKLLGGSVSGNNDVGSLVGASAAKITNSSSTAEITGFQYVGGLVGVNTEVASLINCYTEGTVMGHRQVGGLVGWNAGMLNDCHATGNVTATSEHIGGLVGNNYIGKIENCYATGSVRCGDEYCDNVGGLLGYTNAAKTSVTRSYATGPVSGTNWIGGLVGRIIQGTVSYSYATGRVTASENAAGGLVGRQDGGNTDISNSYATGAVFAPNHVGGLVGEGQGSISRCYATGRVTGSGNMGGLIGSDGTGVTNSYWDIQTSGMVSSPGGVGKTTEQMHQKVTFANWNFLEDWWIHETVNYPRLRMFLAPPVQVIHPIPDTSYTIGFEFSFAVAIDTMQDSHGGAIAYSAQLFGGDALPGWLTFNSATRTFLGNPPQGTLGIIQIEVMGTNTNGYSESDVFMLEVTNCPPVQNKSLIAQSVATGELLEYTFDADTFLDCDGHTLSYTAVQTGEDTLPSWLSFSSATRTFSGMPASGDQENITIEVTASDGFGADAMGLFVVAVINCIPAQDKPLEDQSVSVGEALQYIFDADTFSDCDNDILTYSAARNGGDLLPAWLSFVSSTRRFSGVPASGEQGSLVVTVTASDGWGGNVTGSFVLIVNNLPPILQNPLDDATAFYNVPFGITIPSDTFVDPDGDALLYSATGVDASPLPAWLTFSSTTRMLTGTPTPDNQGTYVIEVRGDDTHGGVAIDTFSITVKAVSGGNNPPLLAVEIPDQTASLGEQWTFVVPANTFEDPDNDLLAYTATLEGGAPLPNWLLFSEQTHTFIGTPITTEAIRLTVRVDDGRGGSALDTFLLTVVDNVNYPPRVENSVPNQYAKVGQAYRLTIPRDTFVDPNGDLLTYMAYEAGNRPLPRWLKFDPATLTFSGKPSRDDTATFSDRSHRIEIEASDGLESATTAFDLHVEGDSMIEYLLKIVAPIATLLSVGCGIYRYRAWLWNHLMKRWYLFPKKEKAVVGEKYTYVITLPAEQIGHVQAYKQGKPLVNKKLLPSWLAHDEVANQLSGTPEEADRGLLFVRIYSDDQRIRKAFTLLVKQNDDDESEEEEGSAQPPSRKARLMQRLRSSKRAGMTPLLDEEQA